MFQTSERASVLYVCRHVQHSICNAFSFSPSPCCSTSSECYCINKPTHLHTQLAQQWKCSRQFSSDHFIRFLPMCKVKIKSAATDIVYYTICNTHMPMIRMWMLQNLHADFIASESIRIKPRCSVVHFQQFAVIPKSAVHTQEKEKDIFSISANKLNDLRVYATLHSIRILKWKSASWGCRGNTTKKGNAHYTVTPSVLPSDCYPLNGNDEFTCQYRKQEYNKTNGLIHKIIYKITRIVSAADNFLCWWKYILKMLSCATVCIESVYIISWSLFYVFSPVVIKYLHAACCVASASPLQLHCMQSERVVISTASTAWSVQKMFVCK